MGMDERECCVHHSPLLFVLTGSADPLFRGVLRYFQGRCLAWIVCEFLCADDGNSLCLWSVLFKHYAAGALFGQYKMM